MGFSFRVPILIFATISISFVASFGCSGGGGAAGGDSNLTDGSGSNTDLTNDDKPKEGPITETTVIADFDKDGILDDGSASGVVGDNYCKAGETKNCDDNCAADKNADQADADGDGRGDVCDPSPNKPDDPPPPSDIDKDGVIDSSDNCPYKENPVQEDADGDKIGDLCDESPLGAEHPFKEVKLVAGAYKWIGYNDGPTIQKFIKDNEYSEEGIFTGPDAGSKLVELANSVNVDRQPARLRGYPEGLSYFKSSSIGKEYIYFSLSYDLRRINLTDGLVEHVAFDASKFGNEDGLGDTATAKTLEDVEIINEDMGSDIKEGDILVSDYFNNGLRRVRVTEGTSGMQSSVKRLNVFVDSPMKITVQNNSIFVLSKPLVGGNHVCGGIFAIDGAVVKLLVDKNGLNKFSGCLDISVLNDRIYVLGYKPDGMGMIAYYDINTGVFINSVDSSQLSDMYSFTWMPQKDAWITTHLNRLMKVTIPNGNNEINITEILGGGEVGWQEINSGWQKFNSKTDVRFNRISSVAFNPEASVMYVSEIGNEAIRALHFAIVDNQVDYNQLLRTELLAGIPPVKSTTGYVDGTDPNKVRFDWTGFLSLNFISNEQGTIGHLLVTDPGNDAIRDIKINAADNTLMEVATLVKGARFDYAATTQDEIGNIYFIVPSYVGDVLLSKLPNNIYNLPTLEERNNSVENLLKKADFPTESISSLFLTSVAYLNNNLFMVDVSNHVIWRYNLADKTLSPFSPFAGKLGEIGYTKYDIEVPASDTLLYHPYVIKALNGRLYLYNYSSAIIQEISFDNAGKAAIKTIAGCTLLEHKDGIGDKACFDDVESISAIAGDKLILASRTNVRLLNLSTREVSTIAGKFGAPGYVDGNLDVARLNDVIGVECSPELKTCFLSDGSAVRILK